MSETVAGGPKCGQSGGSRGFQSLNLKQQFGSFSLKVELYSEEML